jgi:hypothetical protein
MSNPVPGRWRPADPFAEQLWPVVDGWLVGGIWPDENLIDHPRRVDARQALKPRTGQMGSTLKQSPRFGGSHGASIKTS